jgi:streptogramin lyase/lysophospholipase L1-like esterase
LSLRWHWVCALFVVALAIGLLPTRAWAAITEYPAGTQPLGITTGPDGALWFADGLADKIGRITTNGDVVEYPILTAGGSPIHIAAGPDGALWFTEFGGNRIGRITTDGGVTEFLIPTANVRPYGIVAGPDGALWFTEEEGDQVGRITTDGDITEYPIPTAGGSPWGITAGPDGALWFTERGDSGNRIGRITTDGDVTEYPQLPVADSEPAGIVAGPDGALWFTEFTPNATVSQNKIGRITTDGDLTEFTVPTAASGMGDIAAGPDGALWFVEALAGQIGRITTDGEISEFPIDGSHHLWGIAAGPDGALWFTDFFGESGTIRRIPAPLDSISQDAPAGSTVSTNTTTSPEDQVGTSVTTPVAGTVTIDEGSTTTPAPSGYSLLGQQVEITAPDASAAEPLVLEFRLDASLLPPGIDETTIQVFRDGAPITDCDAGAASTATPDPCVAARAATTDGVELTVRTSQASSWNFGVVDTTPPNTTITSGPSGATNDPTPTFAFSSSEAGSTFECKLDSGSYAACSSPKTVSHLADGSHTFYVQATDPGQNADPTPATRPFTVRTAEVKVSGSTLVVTAAVGAKDNLVISKPTTSTLRVTDLPTGAYTGSGVHTGAGCTRNGDYTANCSASGITLIQVSSGDQIDKVTNSTGLKSSLNGGAANDVLTGGSANDILTGGMGADVFQGMNGNDQLLAQDLTSDTTINCDGGTTPGSADQADLDLLPKDPNSAVIGCETKTRPNPYVALGDSLSVGLYASSSAKGFVGLLYSSYRTSLGASELLNEGESGATSTSLRNNGQLSRGLADINNPSDTRAATIEVGANDGFFGPCKDHWSQTSVCPFRANFRDIITRLKAALQTDPGTEKFTTMAYYNPPNAVGAQFGTRADRDRNLLGTNLQVGCSDTGTQVGLNDVIFQEAGKLGIPVADTYPAFKQHGSEYISSSDPWRVHPNDAGYAAIAQAFRNATVRCGS